IASSVLFDNRPSSGQGMTIRGLSTIFSDSQPLIILNNFPYEGDINSINPNDVESIIVLKDATAASISGVRAGNGIIVIMTKKGVRSQGPAVSFTSNIPMIKQPDIMPMQDMSLADYIE